MAQFCERKKGVIKLGATILRPVFVSQRRRVIVKITSSSDRSGLSFDRSVTKFRQAKGLFQSLQTRSFRLRRFTVYGLLLGVRGSVREMSSKSFQMRKQSDKPFRSKGT